MKQIKPSGIKMFENCLDLVSYRWNGVEFVVCSIETENSYIWLQQENLMMKNERFEFDHMKTLKEILFPLSCE